VQLFTVTSKILPGIIVHEPNTSPHILIGADVKVPVDLATRRKRAAGIIYSARFAMLQPADWPASELQTVVVEIPENYTVGNDGLALVLLSVGHSTYAIEDGYIRLVTPVVEGLDNRQLVMMEQGSAIRIDTPEPASHRLVWSNGRLRLWRTRTQQIR
jgi:hypothetical protein